MGLEQRSNEKEDEMIEKKKAIFHAWFDEDKVNLEKVRLYYAEDSDGYMKIEDAMEAAGVSVQDFYECPKEGCDKLHDTVEEAYKCDHVPRPLKR